MGDTTTDGAAGKPGEDAITAATEVYVDHRELLFRVVYGMLGSVADTEDVLQDVWLAWSARRTARDAAQIASPRAYLVRTAVNGALARQASIRRRRETYVGPWLPEPVVDPPGGPGAVAPRDGDASDPAVMADSVSMALLVVLETLTPVERAVFVLHEVFGYSHPETARMLGRSTVAVRQLAHRAREHVRERRLRHRVDPRLTRRVTERFVAAAAGGEVRDLLELLAPDVTLWADGGGKAPAAGRGPVRGRQKVARALVAGRGRFPAGLDVRYRHVNGAPSAVLCREGAPFAVLVVDLDPEDERITGIYLVSNPDKLSHLH
ncbi:RNA polymerase sigma factor SigJ [Streptomyces sp. 4N509B]|uniref:RNA polymerase sigma factor SigJ n=1 Tax=Streptomyces sp. 4N509B TaxID=3457413 RepID=UPI003FD06C27